MKRSAAAIASALVLLAPGVGSALTNDELLSQIQALIAQIQTLQDRAARISQASSSPAVAPVSVARSSCPTFTRNLKRGSKGEDVSSLQKFLAQDPSVYSGDITGFFGSATEAALKKWQARFGVISGGDAATTGWGVLGVSTRNAIAAQCAVARGSSCPNVNLDVKPCFGTWSTTKDSNGCIVSYICTEVIAATSTPRTTQCDVDIAAAEKSALGNICTQSIRKMRCGVDMSYTYSAQNGCVANTLIVRGWQVATSTQ